MLLVLDTDRELYLFATQAETEAWLETIDVENEEYDFCDDCGRRYTADVNLGAVQLIPQEIDVALPLTFWASACHLAKSYNDIRTLDDLAARLHANQT